jgi:hypothetical protein
MVLYNFFYLYKFEKFLMKNFQQKDCFLINKSGHSNLKTL